MKNVRLISLIVILLIGTTFIGTAQRPDAPTYGQRGPLSVGMRDFVIGEDTERSLPATIWYPAIIAPGETGEITYQQGLFTSPGNAQRDAEANLENGPYPLVIFSHGNNGLRYQSTFLTEHLASYGFVVIAIDHPGNTLQDALTSNGSTDLFAESFALRPSDISRTIDYAETNESALADINRIALTGHSFGGWTALAASGLPLNLQQVASECQFPALPDAASLCFQLDIQSDVAQIRGLDSIPSGAWPVVVDPRIKATVAFAPWNGVSLDRSAITDHSVPTLFISGTADNVTPPERDSRPVYDALFRATPKAFVSLSNAGHYIFVNTCPEIAIALDLSDACSDAVWDMERAHDLTNHFTTAFLLAIVYGDEKALSALAESRNEYIGVDYELIDTAIQELRPEVLASYPHDPNAFTQGLLVHDGLIYESTGQYGESSLRQVDPQTGEVLKQVNINEQFFAEGLAKVDNRLLQLTWRSQIAFEMDFNTFEFIQAFGYVGEGWGLCYDGDYLYMSNGSSTLTRRDPTTFEPLEDIPVALRGEAINNLNELECVGDEIYANIWQTDYIMVIDKHTGDVTARIDASGLLTAEESINANVLNGIAHVQDDVFYITGKDWPRLFEVRFAPIENE